MMIAEIFEGKIEGLRHIAESWYADTSYNHLGIEVSIDAHLSDLHKLVTGSRSDLIVLYDKGQAIGYIGITWFISPVGSQKIANEHYWYVMPDKRGKSSLILIHSAQAWAERNECSHLVLNASNLASSLHDKVCKLYERIGMQKFETSYIMEI